ncbi:MAG TPA: glycosyltransferase family 2 protein [Thermoanaerobaculia bacterium]|nr:glycosyltransferase family 2 protein [Thermoanaerobaculia bacterium]
MSASASAPATASPSPVHRAPAPEAVAPAGAADPAAPAVSVVVPAYNERGAVGPFLDELLPAAREAGWEVIVVDDGSTDGTAEVLAARAAEDGDVLRVVTHPLNRGYGAALKSGIRRARAASVATMDSDGQHSPGELARLLPLAADHDLVIGQRTRLLHSPLWRMPGKWVLGWMASHFAGRRIPDLNSGLRVFRTAVIRRYLHLCPEGFSFSTTSTMVLLHRRYAVANVPIAVRPRQGASTVSVRTGFDTLLLILRLVMLLAPLRIFLPLGALSIALGLAWTVPYLLARQGLTVASLLLIVTGVLIVLTGLLADQIAELRKERFEE